jgi:hypothetical protein
MLRGFRPRDAVVIRVHDEHLARRAVLLGGNPLVPEPDEQDAPRGQHHRTLVLAGVAAVIGEHLQRPPGPPAVGRAPEDDVHVVLVLVPVDAPFAERQHRALCADRQRRASVAGVAIPPRRIGNRLHAPRRGIGSAPGHGHRKPQDEKHAALHDQLWRLPSIGRPIVHIFQGLESRMVRRVSGCRWRVSGRKDIEARAWGRHSCLPVTIPSLRTLRAGGEATVPPGSESVFDPLLRAAPRPSTLAPFLIRLSPFGCHPPGGAAEITITSTITSTMD